MHIEDFRELAKRLEHDAWAGGDGIEPFVISLAISAKRIADSLETIAKAFPNAALAAFIRMDQP